jgi:Zn-dependent M28 family amino/carboxypeptidase
MIGAVDNASGASAVIELARLFSMHPPKNTMEFVLFSAEELGFKGRIQSPTLTFRFLIINFV